jgi:hypothetical protein
MGKIFPAASATPVTLFASADGILLAYGTTVPADNATGYAPSCVFLHVDGESASDLVFVNEGTATAANFDSTHS